MSFPIRLSRFRGTPAIRSLTAETQLSAADFVLPLFVSECIAGSRPISSLPDVSQYDLSSLVEEVRSCVAVGIKAVMLFGIPQHKDSRGTAAHDPEGIVQRAIRALKSEFSDLVIMADCCLCEYTDHGHCGIMTESGLDNDETLKILQAVACSYAEAGADVVAPSGMMDGMVASIRTALDQADFTSTLILSYAVKYASHFYGPFREAAGAAGNFKGDRRHHQLAPSQRMEGIREAELDVAEGADMLMVKPAGLYLDMIRDLRERTLLPLAAYHVSGEYAMIKAAAKAGIVDEYEAFNETFIAIKRAGAGLIITYYAKEFLTK